MNDPAQQPSETSHTAGATMELGAQDGAPQAGDNAAREPGELGPAEVLKRVLVAAGAALATLALVREINSRTDFAGIIKGQEQSASGQEGTYLDEVLYDLGRKGEHSVRRPLDRDLLWRGMIEHGLWRPSEIRVVALTTSLGRTIDSQDCGYSRENVAFINGSTRRGSLVDAIVQSFLFEELGIAPGRVIIELTPWMLTVVDRQVASENRARAPQALRDLRLIDDAEYDALLAAADALPVVAGGDERRIHTYDPRYIKESIPYLQKNIQVVVENVIQGRGALDDEDGYDGPERKYFNTDTPLDLRMPLFTDLSRRWAPARRNRPTHRVDALAEKELLTPSFVSSIVAERVAELNALIKFHRNRGASVEFLLFPNYSVYLQTQRRLAQDLGHPFTLEATEAYIRELARKEGILIRGSYQPKADERWFHDRHHQHGRGPHEDFANITYDPSAKRAMDGPHRPSK